MKKKLPPIAFFLRDDHHLPFSTVHVVWIGVTELVVVVDNVDGPGGHQDDATDGQCNKAEEGDGGNDLCNILGGDESKDEEDEKETEDCHGETSVKKLTN